MTASNGLSWSTQDCFETVRAASHEHRFSKVKFNPSNESLVLALTRDNCEDKDQNQRNSFIECIPQNKLMLSVDGGASFRFIRGFVYQFDWLKHADYAENYGNEAIVVTSPDNRLTRQPEKVPKQSQDVSVYFSWDFFKRETRIVDKGSHYWLSKCCLFVQTIDKKGAKHLHSTEVWHNIFNWRQVTIGEGSIQDYLDFGIIKNLNIYTVEPRLISHSCMPQGS